MKEIILIIFFSMGRDTFPPQVEFHFPQKRETIFPYYNKIYIFFTQEMDTSSFDSSSVEIITHSGILPTKAGFVRGFSQNCMKICFSFFWYWQPFDTIQVTVKGYVKGKNGLTLDGNGNGIPEGSPIDDYTFKFFTSDYSSSAIPKDSFPFYYPGTHNWNLNNPGTIMDINKNNDKEIITTWNRIGFPEELGVIDKNAKLLPNFPVSWQPGTRNALYPPAIADLNKDGYFEIIPNAAVTGISPKIAKFYVFTHEGNFFPGWPYTYIADTLNIYNTLHTTVAVCDLDNDEDLEIIFPVRPSYIFIFEKNGNLWNGCPYKIKGALMGLAIGDLNNDEIPEITAIGVSMQQYPVDTTFVNVLEPDGIQFPNFPKKITKISGHQPVLGDINGDGFLEIIFVADTGKNVYPYIDGLIYAIDYEGNILPNFPVKIPDEWFAYSLSLGDLDNDNLPEIIAGTAGQTWHPFVIAVDGNGGILNGFPVYVPVGNAGGSIIEPPSIADINGDGYGEIFVTSNGGDTMNFSGHFIVIELTYITLISSNGNMFPGYPLILPTFSENPALLSDIENDGFLDLTIAHLSTIYSFTTPYTNYTLEWPLPYHDIHNTSNYHYIPPEIPINEFDKYKHLFSLSTSSIARNEFKFKIFLPDGFENKKLKILFYQVDGRKLKEFEFLKIPRKFEYSINVKKLKRGIYFYIFKIENREIGKGKFVKL
jgi:hypothetical protein